MPLPQKYNKEWDAGSPHIVRSVMCGVPDLDSNQNL
jgi:hypothetical protein